MPENEGRRPHQQRGQSTTKALSGEEGAGRLLLTATLLQSCLWEQRVCFLQKLTHTP